MTDQVTINLAEHAWKREFADFTVYGTWYQLGTRPRTPCLVIINAGEERNDHTSPFWVPISDAWRWEEVRGDPAFVAREAVAACIKLRRTPQASLLIRLQSLVHDHLGDLLHIPPFNPANHAPRNVIAEAIITNRSTGVEKHVELRDDV